MRACEVLGRRFGGRVKARDACGVRVVRFAGEAEVLGGELRCPGLSERPHEPTWRVGLVVGVTVRRVQPDGAVRRDEDAVHVVAVRGVFLLEVMTRAVAFDAHDTRCHLFRYEAGGDVLLGLCAACDRSSHQDGYEDGDRQRVLPHQAPVPRLGRAVPRRTGHGSFVGGHPNLPFHCGPILVKTPPDAFWLKFGAAGSAVDRLPTGRASSSSLDIPPVRLDA